MIKTKFAGIEIGADFTFFAIIAMFLTLDTTGFAMMSLAVCLIHEAGHLLIMLITGEKPESIMFRGGGIRISSNSTSVPVLLAGSTVNIGIFFALYFTLPKTDIYPVMFAVLNLTIGVFNLLPIGCLDGKRLLEMFISEKILKAIEAVMLVIVVVVIIVVIMHGGVNLTFAAAMVYILSVDYFLYRF